MSVITVPAARADIKALAAAMRQSNALDAVPLNLSEVQWNTLAGYLQPVLLRQGQSLIEQGVKDRTVYLVESGTLTVHYEDSHDRIRIAVVGEGSLLGEGAFFSHLPRSATVSAGSDCRLWCLTPLRFRELCTRAPEVALELTVAMSAVLARRMYNKPKRVAVT
ncbi:Crp/Fnr family transcriptional regulator [uncultured Hydrogenophaga sp.]|uniref:Crp/Fnr family transcriptional regulator n=1 Tax=uncultured Hydrogenophaga sp. TaxID=199683 RepID=UPI00265F55A5|nr:cyclic nucleotide-binding domain-containing protein [uncultured Hydrogenophaga sp.]